MSFAAAKPLLLVAAVALAAPLAPIVAQQKSGSDWSDIEATLGRNGAIQPDGAIKFSFPRTDMSVSVSGVKLAPAFALGSWIAFKRIGPDRAIAMGDLVLAESEVDVVMRALQTGGIMQTAVHNHLLGESPRVVYMHIMAERDPQTIASALHASLAQSSTPLGPAAPPAVPSARDLDTSGIASALGIRGKLNGTVYQVSVPRSEKIVEMGQEIPPSMGVATAINFQPTGEGKTAITGDFVLQGSEVNPVIRALTSHGITVTAVHSHMIDEQPHLYFMHFWANADAVTLAKGLRAALDATASKKM